MADLLRAGATWLESRRRKFVATPVVYTRGASSVTVPATKGRSEFDHADANGILTRVETADFIIGVFDLELDGEPTEPSAGDRIIEGDIEAGEVYEVHAVEGGPPWRWSGEHRQAYRIHVRHLGTQPPVVT